MRKSIKHILAFVLAVMMSVSFSNPVMAKESNTVDKNGNSVVDMQQSFGRGCSIKIGDEIYYTVNLEPREGIYKINKKATKTQRILKKSGSIGCLSHYGKWIYFIWDKDGGGNGCSMEENSWLCKVKLNGTGFKTICRSNRCMIRNDMLYYQKTKNDYDQYGYRTDIDIGKIGILNLKTGKKSTFKGKNMHLTAVENNKIYYFTSNEQENILYSMDTKGKNRKKLQKDYEWWNSIIYDDCLYWIDQNKLYKKSFMTKKTKKLCAFKNLSEDGIVDIKNDKVYIVAGNDSKVKLYSISIKSGKKKCIMKLYEQSLEWRIYGNYVIASRQWWNKTYTDKNNHIYNVELYSYNLKTKKRVRLLTWFEQ
ncbi:MAG: DUF5050 domain-containing protein [Clostridiales bacterium]|nr:DUF5050 domain-containing protein [Clostridiales bacterium]